VAKIEVEVTPPKMALFAKREVDVVFWKRAFVP